MDINIRNVDHRASESDVTKAIARILHTEDGFRPTEPGERLLNFKVKLHLSGVGVRNDGTGTLSLPSREVRRL